MPLNKKPFLLVSLLAALLLISLFLFKEKLHMRDFEVNYTAAKRVRMGEPLYQTEDGHYMFKYLPSSALLYLPLSFLPLDVAKGIWFLVVVFSLGSLVYISKRLLDSKIKKPIYLFIFPPLILSKFFLREIQLGQINAVVGLFLFFMVWVLVSEKIDSFSKREVYAGLLWGAATALKPHALIFLPYFLVKKNWRSTLSGLSFLTLCLLVPAISYGFLGAINLLSAWWATLSRSTPRLLTSQDNISILAFFMKRTDNQKISLLLFGIIAVLLASLVFIMIMRGKKSVRSAVLESSVLLICIPLISPLGWDYTLLVSVLGITVILNDFFRYSKFWRGFLVVNCLIIAFSLYDLMGRELYAAFMSWSVITVNFLILIGYLAFLRFRNHY